MHNVGCFLALDVELVGVPCDVRPLASPVGRSEYGMVGTAVFRGDVGTHNQNLLVVVVCRGLDTLLPFSFLPMYGLEAVI